MVEKVEHFGTELQVEPFGYLRVFYQREIRVYEVGARRNCVTGKNFQVAATQLSDGLEVSVGRIRAKEVYPPGEYNFS